MKKQNLQEIRVALENVHKSKCLAAKQILRTKLLLLRMTKDQNIRQFANKICLLETELSCTENETVQEDNKFVLLNGLRLEFSSKKAILQERNISFEEMVSVLGVTGSKISTSQPPNNNASNAANAFIADRSKKKCTICNRVDHTYYDCWYNPKSKYYKENKKPSPKMVEQLKRMKLFKRNKNDEDSKFEDKRSTNESHYVFITSNENNRSK